MRIHTNNLDTGDAARILYALQRAGLVADHLHFHVLEQHGSRKRDHALEVQLGTYTKVPGDLRSWKNSGTRGAESEGWGEGVYAATYDEWGYFLAALYLADSELWCQYHGDRAGFGRLTATRRNSRQRVFDYITPVALAIGRNAA